MKALRVIGVFTLLNEDQRGCRQNTGAGFFSELVLIGCKVGGQEFHHGARRYLQEEKVDSFA